MEKENVKNLVNLTILMIDIQKFQFIYYQGINQ